MIRCGQVNNALHLFQYVSKDNLFKQRVKIPPSSTEMPKYYQIFSNIRLNARSYNTLLKGIRFLDGDQVFTTSLYVLDLMKSRGIHPDSITINTIIDACAKSGNLNTARDVSFMFLCFSSKFMILNYYLFIVSQLIMSSDVRPSIEAYSAIIGGYADRFKTDEALGMLEVMKDQDIKPNAFIITAVMNACFQSRNFQKAREVLRQARDLFGILSKEDLAALYSAYITGLCKSHVQLMKTNDPSKKISSKKYFLEAQNTMLKMLNKEMLPNIAAINAFMQSLCVFPQPFLKEALIFLKEAKKCQIIPDAYTYSILFGSLGKNGQVQQAIDLYYNASLASNLDTTAMNSLLRSVSICNPQRSIDLFYEIMNRMNHTSMVASDQFRNMAQVAVALPDAITFTTLYTSLLPKVFLFEQDYESDDSIVPPPKEQLEQDNDLGDVHSSDKESFGSSLQQQIRQSPIQGVYSSLLSIVKIIDIDRKKDSDDTNDNGMWGSATDGEKDWKPMSNKEAVFWKLYQLMRNEFNIIPDLVMAGVINTLFLHLFADGFLPRLDFSKLSLLL